MKIAILFGGTLSLGWGRAQNIAKALSHKGHEVWYLNEIEPLLKKRVFRPSIEKNIDGIHCVSNIVSLPSVRFPILHTVNMQMMKRQLKTVIPKMGTFDMLIFYGVPQPWLQDYLLESIPYKSAIYDCADDKQETFNDLINTATGKSVHTWELELLTKVDGLSAINSSLINKIHPHTSISTLVIPNGIDTRHFVTKEAKTKTSKNNRIVCAGAINNRIDSEKLNALADQPGITIDLLGPYNSFVDSLTKHSSITYGGYVQYQNLPSALKKYDIGLMAYKNIESIKQSSPLKILQYLACGLPVLTFPVDAWDDMQQHITTLQGTLPISMQFPLEREKLLQQYSWEKLIVQFELWFKELISVQ